jgi:hypothetical protein
MVSARPPFLFPPGPCDLPPAHSPPPLLGHLPLPRPSHRPPSPSGLGLRPAQPPPPSPLTVVWTPPGLLPPRETDGVAAVATASTRAHRPGVPSSSGNGVAPPPLFTPRSPLRFPSPPNRTTGIDAATTGRPIPFPVWPSI